MPQETELFEKLEEYETPSVSNLVASFPKNPLYFVLYKTLIKNWYIDQSIRCIYPELGRTVGYAVTYIYSLLDQSYSRLSFIDVIDAMDQLKKPTVLIINQIFPPEITGKVSLSRGNIIPVLKSIGCIGVISDDSSSDRYKIRSMKFQYVLTCVTVGHVK